MNESAKYVAQVVELLKGLGLNMQFHPEADDSTQCWQYDGFDDDSDLYISIYWTVARVDIGISNHHDSTTFGGLCAWNDKEQEMKDIPAFIDQLARMSASMQ